MFVLEAMAAGVPVIATPVGSVARIVGDAGLIVPAGDAGALAEAIVRVLADPAQLDAMSREAQRRVAAEFSTEIFERNVGELYGATFGKTLSS